MATLPTRSFDTIVQTIAAGIQGRAAALIDFTIGSPLRAISEAVAGVGLWLQAMFLQVLQTTRLSTSSGGDVDSFVADFGLSRLPASLASGYLTFSRFTAGSTQPFVATGTTVQSSDGTQNVAVIADTTNPAYSASPDGYTFASGSNTLTVKAQAQTTGTGGNVAANTMNVMTTPIVGVDTVTNGASFTGGQAAETDAALKSRFNLFILGLSRGDLYGVESALSNLNVAIQYTITDQYSYAGVFTPGFFYAVVDDGSGSPSSTFLNAAENAISAVKPLGVNFSVFAPAIVSANVGMLLTTAPGYTHGDVVAAVASLIASNIAALGLGAGLPYSLLCSWPYQVAGVTNATGIVLNSGTADIPANNNNRVMPGTITVS